MLRESIEASGRSAHKDDNSNEGANLIKVRGKGLSSFAKDSELRWGEKSEVTVFPDIQGLSGILNPFSIKGVEI